MDRMIEADEEMGRHLINVRSERPREILDCDPMQRIAKGTQIAEALTSVIESKKMHTRIQGRKHINVEGWQVLAAMCGVSPIEREATCDDQGNWTAVVELVDGYGAVVGRGSGFVGANETTWANREEYAKRSMAITRAVSKACRLKYAWIPQIAGYATTPTEEMPSEPVEAAKPKPKRRPKAKPAPADNPGVIGPAAQSVIDLLRKFGESGDVGSIDAIKADYVKSRDSYTAAEQMEIELAGVEAREKCASE